MRTISIGMMTGLVFCAGIGAAMAGPDHDAAPVASSSELERVKSLAGRWEGTMREGDGTGGPAAVEYKVTSGGSVVVETLFPGTPHEMVSVYHDAPGGQLSLTHYCMLGNQPELNLVSAADRQMDFSLASGSAIPASEQHMHALTLTWLDPDHLRQVWTSQKDGQANNPTTIELSRVR